MNRKPFTTDTTFLFVDGPPDGRRFPITLAWSPEAPLEVWFLFPHPHPWWMVSRDLLAGGLTTDAGQGDVRVSPHRPAGVNIVLHGRQFSVAVRVSRRMLRVFLNKTFQRIPAGQEVIPELDRELQELTG
jgi:hypothetical protein